MKRSMLICAAPRRVSYVCGSQGHVPFEVILEGRDPRGRTLGMFRKGAGCCSLLRDSEPVFLILLYNLWPVLTERFFRCTQPPQPTMEECD